MGLFQKQPITNTQPLYIIDSEKTLLVVGLGNIGKKYAGTRHNIGFSLVDNFALAQEFPAWQNKKNLSCQLTSKNLGKTKVILAKPTTYMNDSGKALGALQNFFKVDISEILVIYDEIDIGFGQIRTVSGGGSAGHRGVESIISQCGEDFWRLRVGIGPKQPDQIDSADFVLQKFSNDEQEALDKLQKEAINILNEYIFSGGKLNKETRNFIIGQGHRPKIN